MEKEWSLPPLHRIERCLLCPCGAGACRLLTSNTLKNPGRHFFKCPDTQQCWYGTNGFFKWVDQVKANEYIDVPYCGGCNGGPCRVTKEIGGPNAGRILFTCTIKPDQGDCGFSVYQDELEMSWMSQVHTIRRSPPVTSTKCDGNAAPDIGVVKENIPNNNVLNDQSTGISTSVRPKSRRTTSRKTKKSKLREDEPEETLRSPLKRLRNGSQVSFSFVSAQPHISNVVVNSALVKPQWWMTTAIHQNLGPELKGWWGRLVFYSLSRMDIPAPEPTVWRFTLLVDPLLIVHGKKQVNSDASNMLQLDKVDAQIDNMVNDISSATITATPVSVCNAEPENGVKHLPVDHYLPLRNEPFEKNTFNHAVSDSVSKAFRIAAEQLQNDLFVLLENADSKDQETMKQAAEATSAALDHLNIDHQHLEKRVNEFISHSVSLAAIEQSMVTNDSYQELELQCKFERLKLDEMESAHTKAVDIVMRTKKSLEMLHGVICSAKEWLFDVEAEYLCSQLELLDMEAQLEKNFAEKLVLEEKFVIASKELEDTTSKLQKRREEAKVAFDRAKALLRG